MISCPHCQSVLQEAPELQAGQQVRCLNCGNVFEAEAVPPPVVTRQIPPPVAPPTPRATGTQWQRMAKVGMLVVTGLWLLGMPAFAVLSYVGSMSGGGDYRRWQESDVFIHKRTSDTIFEDEMREIAIAGAITSGLCCPTVPYVIGMVVLGVVWVASKPDR